MNEKRYFIKKSFHKCHTSKIIFLDVDGVLNHHPLRNDNYDLEPDLLDNLELIVKKTKAAIMLTSSRSFGTGKGLMISLGNNILGPKMQNNYMMRLIF